MQTINGELYVTDQDMRFFARLPVEGTTRVFHLFPDANSILHLCEWKEGRYVCPSELPSTRLAGSSLDEGHRLAGSKHSACVLNVQTNPDGSRVLQAMWASRPPGQSDGPFRGTFRAFHEIRLPSAPWAGLMQRLVALERALGNQGEGDPTAALEARVTTLEARQRDAGKALSGA
jgi:hypothetical protein